MKTPFSTNLAPTEAEGSTGQARPADKPDAAPYKTANCEEWRSFPPFFLFFFSRDAEEWRLDFTQRRVK